jgi:hypothetical protein
MAAIAETKTGPLTASPLDICAKSPQSSAAPVPAMVPAMPTVVAMVTVVSHFRRCCLGILLDRHGGAGIAERQSPCALGRSGQNEQRANGGKPENFPHLHIIVSLGHRMSRLRRTV